MRTRVGYVPDSCGAYQSLSAAENLRIRCAEWGLDEKREIPRVLGLVGLDVDEKEREQFFSGNETATGYSYGFIGRHRRTNFR